MTLRLLSGFDNDNWKKKIHCCRVFQKLLIECFLSKLLIVKVNDKEVLNSQFWQLDFSPKNGSLVTLIFWNKFSQSFCQFNFSKKNLENVKKVGKRKRLFRSDWRGKIQRKVVFYRWWDRQGEIFSRKSFLVPAWFGDKGVQVDNQKDMKRAVLHLVQVFHTHNFGDHIGAI